MMAENVTFWKQLWRNSFPLGCKILFMSNLLSLSDEMNKWIHITLMKMNYLLVLPGLKQGQEYGGYG